MKIAITYENGNVLNLEADPVGDGDAGNIVAACGSVALTRKGLVFTPRVLPWNGGSWRVPSGVVDEWSVTESGPDYRNGDDRISEVGDTTRISRRAEKQRYARNSYLLLTASELDGAVSIVIDGALAWVAENGALVPASGGDGVSLGDDGMTQHFAKVNHPADYGLTGQTTTFAQQVNGIDYGFGR